jgi:hypothetical protein
MLATFGKKDVAAEKKNGAQRVIPIVSFFEQTLLSETEFINSTTPTLAGYNSIFHICHILFLNYYEDNNIIILFF